MTTAATEPTLTTTHPLAPGRPWPLGVTLTGDGVNVAVWAPEATAVWLCLFDAERHETRLALDAQTDGVWHGHVAGVGPGARYGLRAADEDASFNPDKLLIDPYAQQLDAPLRWHPLMTLAEPGDSAPVMPLGVVAPTPQGVDPAENRPHHPYTSLVVYEAHAKGLTATHPGVPDELRGTYAGLAHPALIGHLQRIGVTALELLPLHSFIDDEHLVELGLSNYWGYQPVAMLAPEPRYALRDAPSELRAAVHALHEAGIEVILDVVFNHSGEGNERGPTLSMRGLNERGYYRHDESGHLIDDTGTGNSLKVAEPMVLRLVLDALRNWATRYGVDGFRFDLATTLGRTDLAHDGGFDSRAAFFQAVAQDPVLNQLKLIAEPWDIGPGGYRLGGYPRPWREWNDRFRDDVRSAWRGDLHSMQGLASRLLGSAVQFDHNGRAATSSINFVAAHDGFTLADTVAYAHKHNEANGEGNRDGHDHNYTDNLGVEGPSDDPAIAAARSRRVRAMLATLFVSQGIPMLLAGDELGNSQGGNNNAYAQDNEIGWVSWEASDDALIAFTSELVALRKRLPLLRQPRFLHGDLRQDGSPDVAWLTPDGSVATEEYWHDPAHRTIVMRLRGAAGAAASEAARGSVLIIVNTGSDLEVQLPMPGEGGGWVCELDSARSVLGGDGDESALTAATYRTLAQSVVVLAENV